MIAVVDACVAVKWFLRDSPVEQHADLALRLLEKSVLGLLPMVQSVHFVAEVAAVLARLKPTEAHDDLFVYLPSVLLLCPGVTEPNRLGAPVDFAYNLGANNLKTSTLRRRVNEGRGDEVPAELRKWVRGGGRVLRGLVLRREAEAALTP